MAEEEGGGGEEEGSEGEDGARFHGERSFLSEAGRLGRGATAIF